MYVTDRAWDRVDGESAPFYEDLDRHRRKADVHQTPFTSAVPLFRALAVAVEEIVAEGMAARIRRHRTQSAAFRAGFQALGLDPFPTVEGETERSNALPAISLSAGIRGDADGFFDAVAERDVSISGGQAHLDGDVFRVSNMGNLAPADVERGVRTVGEALGDAGVDCDPAAGVAAVSRAFEA